MMMGTVVFHSHSLPTSSLCSLHPTCDKYTLKPKNCPQYKIDQQLFISPVFCMASDLQFLVVVILLDNGNKDVCISRRLHRLRVLLTCPVLSEHGSIKWRERMHPFRQTLLSGQSKYWYTLVSRHFLRNSFLSFVQQGLAHSKASREWRIYFQKWDSKYETACRKNTVSHSKSIDNATRKRK